MFIRWPSALMFTAVLMTVFGCAQGPASTSGPPAPPEGSPATTPPATTPVATAPSSQTLTGDLAFKRWLRNDPDGYALTLEEILFIQVRLRSSSPTAGPVIDFQDDGSWLTYGSDYTGVGTDPNCSEEDHGEAAGAFSTNGGMISAQYSTGSLAPRSIRLNFTFGYNGTHRILGGCEPSRAIVDYVAKDRDRFQYSTFGCDADIPTGLPVSPSGGVFDFNCANTDYKFSVGGQLSAVVNTGTLALSP